MILVTGASGFLGKHLVRHLSGQGQQVRALYHRHPPVAELAALPGIEWVQCDLLDIFAVQEVMAGIRHIYHCAAIVSFHPRRHKEMLHFNPESTANIINQALEQGIDRLVYVSSVAALSRANQINKEITEDEEWAENKYTTVYGRSKYLSEAEVWRGIGEGLNAVIVNPGTILGAGDGLDLSAQLMGEVYNELPFYSSGVTAWVDVGDVVRLLTLLMASDRSAERYIVSSGNFAFREICTLMAHALHKKPPRFHANTFMTGMLWRWNTVKSAVSGKPALITREAANNAHALSFYNNQKLLETFPEFTYTPISESIEQMARSFMISYKK